MKPSDRRLTPEWLLDCVLDYFGGSIGLDPCTEPYNPLLAQRYLIVRGLEVDWLSACGPSRTVWVNPPWSSRAPWDQACLEASNQGLDVLTISSVDFTTAWWQALERTASARVDLHRRVKCLDPDTGRMMKVARSCSVWAFSASSAADRLDRAFGAVGSVYSMRPRWVRR